MFETEKAEANTGAMVALYPSPDVAQQLAQEGGEPVEELHLTLAFLGGAAAIGEPEALKGLVQGFAAATPPLAGEIAGLGHFTSGEEAVTYASPDLPGLPGMRQCLVEALEEAGFGPSKEHGYIPHITLAYDHREPDVPNVPLRFECLSLVLGDERTDYPLTGKEPTVKHEIIARTVDGKRELTVPLWKDDAKQIVYGVVMQPDVADSAGDWQSAEDIEAAAHRYLAESRKHDVQHEEEQVAVVPVESFIAPADMEIAGAPVLKGSWVMAVKVEDPEVWAAVQKGDLTGFSIGGTGVREE
jgi:2'-5' RNA ligase